MKGWILVFALLVSVGCSDLSHGRQASIAQGPKLLHLDADQDIACRGGVSVEQEGATFHVRYRTITGPVEVHGIHKVEITDLPPGQLVANHEKTGNASQDERYAACFGTTSAPAQAVSKAEKWGAQFGGVQVPTVDCHDKSGKREVDARLGQEIRRRDGCLRAWADFEAACG